MRLKVNENINSHKPTERCNIDWLFIYRTQFTNTAFDINVQQTSTISAALGNVAVMVPNQQVLGLPPRMNEFHCSCCRRYKIPFHFNVLYSLASNCSTDITDQTRDSTAYVLTERTVSTIKNEIRYRISTSKTKRSKCTVPGSVLGPYVDIYYLLR